MRIKMKNFHEWLEEKHPESLEEGKFGNYMKKFALPVTAAIGMTAAALTGTGNMPQPNNNKPAAVRTVVNPDADRLLGQEEIKMSDSRDNHGKRRIANRPAAGRTVVNPDANRLLDN